MKTHVFMSIKLTPDENTRRKSFFSITVSDFTHILKEIIKKLGVLPFLIFFTVAVLHLEQIVALIGWLTLIFLAVWLDYEQFVANPVYIYWMPM